jgi:hypothetical protein
VNLFKLADQFEDDEEQPKLQSDSESDNDSGRHHSDNESDLNKSITHREICELSSQYPNLIKMLEERVREFLNNDITWNSWYQYSTHVAQSEQPPNEEVVLNLWLGETPQADIKLDEGERKIMKRFYLTMKAHHDGSQVQDKMKDVAGRNQRILYCCIQDV